jgi:hypothetical protein
MQSKYKTGLMRLNLLTAAVLLALLAHQAEPLATALMLWMGVAWLAVTTALLAFSHRRPAAMPWQLLPSLLLAGLLWTAPERHALWVWVWPLLLLLPQPGWMLGLNMVLAGLSWWSLQVLLSVEQLVFSGLLLLTLMLPGLTRHRHLYSQRLAARQRVRLVPGLSLWPAHQLVPDLRQERARCQRDGVHGELLLLRMPYRRFWPLAHELCHQIHDFENCYRLDHRTLAALLLSRDDEQAGYRRQMLLQGLRTPVKARFVRLDAIDSLDQQITRLRQQQAPLEIDTEIKHG